MLKKNDPPPRGSSPFQLTLGRFHEVGAHFPDDGAERVYKWQSVHQHVLGQVVPVWGETETGERERA